MSTQPNNELALSRTYSRPRQLERIHSGRYLDDHGAYYFEHAHTHEEEDEDSTNTTLAGDIEEQEKEIEKEIGKDGTDESSTPEAQVYMGIVDERDRDLESGLQMKKTTTTKSIKDPNIINWDSPDDPANPKNWTSKSKWAATFVVSSFTFISPVSSSMVAPALGAMATEFGVKNEIEKSLMLSIFVLAYAVGPLFLGPLSEIYGRVPVLQLANLFYLAFNIACGEATSIGQMIAFRFLAGLGGSAPLALGGGVLADIYKAEERGKAISIYSLAPLLGPAVGPIAGAFVTSNTSWRWIFRSVSIADAVIQCVGLVYLRETYAPVILGRKAKQLRKETGNPKLRTPYDVVGKTLINTLKTSLSRPFILLGTQIIVQVLAVYMAFLYGMMYLVLSTFPTLWEVTYHEPVWKGGLHYIALGLGFFLGTQICAPLNDRIYRKLKAGNNGVGEPEFRVPLMNVGAFLVPIGLIIYGWCANYHVFWLAVDIGACIFTAGTIIGFQCIQTYIVDSYTRYAASAIGAVTVLRSLAGFGFPLFAPYMYRSLGNGWGNTMLALIAVVLGGPAPFLLWKYGKKLRSRSTFAAGQ